MTFGVVVTSSVRIAGVLLVFSYLIVPAAVGALLAKSVAWRLLIGWALGFVVSVLGLYSSFTLDLPTGAAVVVTFGALIAAVALTLGARALIREVRRQGRRALRSPGIAALALVAILGGLLVLFPGLDHHWLNWLEDAIPPVELAFLTPGERRAYHDSREGMARGLAELQRLLAMQQEVQWGKREMSPEMQERLKQFLASRGEIAAGDRMVLLTLRGRARERQRYWLGLPLLALGAAGALALTRTRAKS